MLYLILVLWLLSPFALIPLCIKFKGEKDKLESFIDELYSKGRIDLAERSSRRVQNNKTSYDLNNMSPVFSEKREEKPLQAPPQPVKKEEKEAPPVYKMPENNMASEAPKPAENRSTPPVYTFPSQTNESRNTPPVYTFTSQASPANEKPDIPPAYTPASRAEERRDIPVYTVPQQNLAAVNGEKKRAGAMSVLMMIGIVFVILAGLIFSTAVWVNLGNLGRTAAIATVGAMFFGISAFTKKKLGLDKTSFAFYTLGSFFASITLITAGYFGMFGEYLSVKGEGSMLLYSIALMLLTAVSAFGMKLFDHAPAAYITSFSGIFSLMLLIMQFTSDTCGFALLGGLIAAAINIALFAYEINIPEKWSKPVNTAAAVFNAVTLITAVTGAFSENSLFIAVCAVFIARSAAGFALGIKEKGSYGKAAFAWTSVFCIGFFGVMLIDKLAADNGISALCTAIFGVIFAAGLLTPDIPMKGSWEKAVKTAALILNAVGIISSVSLLTENFGSWSGVCYAVSAVYILSAFFSAFMASAGHSVYKRAPSAFSSLFIGMAFSVMLVAELSADASAAALIFTVMLLVFINAVFTAGVKIPDSWKLPAYLSVGVLGFISLSLSLYELLIKGIFMTKGEFMGDFEWSIAGYVTAILYILQAAVIMLAAFRKHEEYGKQGWAVISQIIGTGFTLMLIEKLTEYEYDSIALFAFEIFAVLYLNFVHTLKTDKPEGWKMPLDICSYVLGALTALPAFAALFGIPSWIGWDYAAAVPFMGYAVFVIFAAFKGHREYAKTHWAYISQITGILFTLLFMKKLSCEESVFSVLLTVFAMIYLNAVNTLKIKKPEAWKNSLEICPLVTGAVSIAFTAIPMITDSMEKIFPYIISASVYIIYALLTAVLAFGGHENYSRSRWAVISQSVGIFFGSVLISMAAGRLNWQYDRETLFVLCFTIFGAAFSAAAELLYLKAPEKWAPVTKVCDIALNSITAFIALGFMVRDTGVWDKTLLVTSLIWTAYTAVRGIKHENIFLKGAEAAVSGFAAINLCCMITPPLSDDLAVLVLSLIFFVLGLIHHYVKRIRTAFSDILLPVALFVSSVIFTVWGESIYGVISFALLGAVMLIKSREKDSGMSEIFGILLPVPVCGMSFTLITFILGRDYPELFFINAAVCGGVLAAIAGAIILMKCPEKRFYSFALTATFMTAMAVGSDTLPVIIAAAAVSVFLAALFCSSRNDLPSAVNVICIAVICGKTADLLSTETFDAHIIAALILAAASLCASRLVFNRKLFSNENGRISLDTFCFGMLAALPIIPFDGTRMTAFTVLLILGAFAANLARKENSGDVNRSALTAGCALFTAALIFRPFLTVEDRLFAWKVPLLLVCLFGYAFSRIWKSRPKLSENVSSAIYGVCFVILIIDALTFQTLANTLMVLGVSLGILLYSFVSKKKRWFVISAISLTGLTLYMFRDFFLMIDWWVYLLIVGLILIAVSSANEYFVKKSKELKEKAGRFFEDWTW